MVLIILVLGVVSVLNTDVDFLPDMDLPYVVVATVYAGQPAEIVEKDVTAVLEKALGNMSAVQAVTSMSYDNVSVISLQLASGSDVDLVADDIAGRIDGASLPDSAYSKPIPTCCLPCHSPSRARARACWTIWIISTPWQTAYARWTACRK